MAMSIGPCQCTGDVFVKDDHFVCLKCSDEVEPCCAACGHEINQFRRKFPRFCTKCGCPFQARRVRIKCTNCGEVLLPKQRFCEDCGTANHVEHLNGTNSSSLREVNRSSTGSVSQDSAPLMNRVVTITDHPFIEQLTSLLQTAHSIDYTGAFPHSTNTGQLNSHGGTAISLAYSGGTNFFDTQAAASSSVAFRNFTHQPLSASDAFPNSTSTGQLHDAPGSISMSLGSTGGQNIVDTQPAALSAASKNSAYMSYLDGLSASISLGQPFTSASATSPESSAGRPGVNSQGSVASAGSRHYARSLPVLNFVVSVPISLDQSERLLAAISTSNNFQRNGSSNAGPFAAMPITYFLGTELSAGVAGNASAVASTPNDREASEKPQENPSITPKDQAPYRDHGTESSAGVAGIAGAAASTSNDREASEKPEKNPSITLKNQEPCREHGTTLPHHVAGASLGAVTTRNEIEPEKPKENSLITPLADAHHREYGTALRTHVACDERASVVNDREASEKRQMNPSINSDDLAACGEHGAESSAGVSGIAGAAESTSNDREGSDKPQENPSIAPKHQAPSREHGASRESLDRQLPSAGPRSGPPSTVRNTSTLNLPGTTLPHHVASASLGAVTTRNEREPEKPKENSSITPLADARHREYGATQNDGAKPLEQQKEQQQQLRPERTVEEQLAITDLESQKQQHDTVLRTHVAGHAVASVSTLNDIKASEKSQMNPSIASDDQAACGEHAEATMSLSEKAKVLNEQYPCDQAEGCSAELGHAIGTASSNVRFAQSTLLSGDWRDAKPREMDERRINDQGIYQSCKAEGNAIGTASSNVRFAQSTLLSGDWRDAKPRELDERRINDQGICQSCKAQGQPVENDSANVLASLTEPSTRELVSSKNSPNTMMRQLLHQPGQPVVNDSKNVRPSLTEPITRDPVSAQDSYTSLERQLLRQPGYVLANEENEDTSIPPISVDDSFSIEMRPQCD